MKKGHLIRESFELAYIAEKALKEAVHEAIKDHARTGDSLAIWKGGRVVNISAQKLIKRKA